MNSYKPMASLLLLSMIALLGCSRDAADESASSPTTTSVDRPDVPGVTADAATQRGLAIELAAVTTATVAAQARGTATVIDSAAFATATADLESLRAEAAVASENEKRLERLYQDDGNASRQSVDAARQQNSSLRAKLAGAESRARLDWGLKLGSATDTASVRLRADIVRGRVTLFRAEFSDALGEASALKYELVTAHGAPVVLEYFDRSRAVAQFAAGDSVLLGLRAQSAADRSFRPNERLPIIATATGAARPLVPAAAAIAYQGRLWCYVAREANRFDRLPLDTEASTAQGYSAGDSIKAGDQVVVRGAVLLLSLERSASADSGSGAEE